MLINGKPKSYCRAYRIWQGMKKRCYNPKDHHYYIYGGRGIKVCDEWKNSSDAFLEWAYSHGYSDELEIDRIDSNGDYCPENCQWITKSENAKKTNPRNSLPYSDIKRAHKIWEYCKSVGIRMDNFPEPKYPWQK